MRAFALSLKYPKTILDTIQPMLSFCHEHFLPPLFEFSTDSQLGDAVLYDRVHCVGYVDRAGYSRDAAGVRSKFYGCNVGYAQILFAHTRSYARGKKERSHSSSLSSGKTKRYNLLLLKSTKEERLQGGHFILVHLVKRNG